MRWPEQKKGTENPRSRYTPRQVEQMKERRELGGVTYRQLAEEYGGSVSTVHETLKRESAES